MQYSKAYNGIMIESFRVFIGSSIYLGTYFYLRNEFNQNNNILVSSFFGILSNMISWSIIFPLDTIRTIKQTSNKTYPKILLDYKHINSKYI